MNPAMIRPSKQGQRLGREILYMPIDKARKKGTQIESSKTLILLSSQVLAILTLASEALWQAPHWCPYFLFDLSLDQVSLWTIPVWTNLFTNDPSIISLAPSVGNEYYSTRDLSQLTHKSRWKPTLTQILPHWLYKFSHSQPLWRNLPGKTRR